jgi:hypothetical protein
MQMWMELHLPVVCSLPQPAVPLEMLCSLVQMQHWLQDWQRGLTRWAIRWHWLLEAPRPLDGCC